MANWIHYYLDVLAGSSEEINRIEARLKKPSSNLVRWVAERGNGTPDEVRPNVTELVSFEPVKNLFYTSPPLNKARRFKNSFKSWTGIVNSHLYEVSEEFPNAVLLLEYRDDQWSCSGKLVIFGGKEIHLIHDGDHHSQAFDWALLDIFAPFTAEWNEGLAFGTLWNEWLEDVIAAANKLKAAPPNEQSTEDDKAAV